MKKFKLFLNAIACLIFLFSLEGYTQTVVKSLTTELLRAKIYSLTNHDLLKIKQSDYFNGQANETSKSSISILSQNFSGTTFPPTGWTAQAISVPLNWARGTSLQLSYDALSPTGATFSNGYAWANSDGVASNQPTEDCVLKTPAMNCSSYTNVWLKFNEFFRQYNPLCTGHAEVSTDGTTWTTIYSSETGLTANQGTANPNNVDVDISSYAAGQATVYIRFHWTGKNGYYWIVDDVDIYSRTDYDVALISAVNPQEYVVIPRVHYNSSAMTLSATVKNLGNSSVSNVYMEVKVFNLSTMTTVHTVNSNTIASIASNSTAILTATSYTPPSDTGIYRARYVVHMTQTDADHSNDTIRRGFWISDSLYARSDEAYTGQADGSLGVGSGSIAIMGNDYTLNTPDKISMINAYVTQPSVGDTTQMYVYLTDGNGSPTAVVASTPTYKFTTAGPQWLSLPIQGGAYQLNPGTYFIGLKDFTTSNVIGLAYTNDNFTAGKSWVKVNASAFDSLEDFGYTGTFIIEPYLVCGSLKTTASADDSIICAGSYTNLHATNGTTYSWSPTNGLNSADIANPVATPASTTTYTVIITNTNGCSASDNVTITVDPNIVTNITSTDEMSGQSDGTATVSVTSGGISPFSYFWSTVPPQTNSTAAGLAAGTYVVTVTDAQGCVAIDTVIVNSITTGIEENNETPQINISPNPSKGNFTVEITSKCQKEVNIIIMDISGRAVLIEKWAVTSGTFTKNIDLQTIAKGVYFIKVITNKSVFTEKVEINK